MKDTVKPPRLGKEEWLSLALDTLAEEGGARLRIDDLVRKLNVTKGSFYWHFENREQFINELLDYWHRTSTVVVPEFLGNEGSPAERLTKLVNYIFKEKLTRYDLAIRSWAIQEPAIGKRVKQTDEFRLRFVQDLFTEMGFSQPVAKIRARTLITYAALYGAVFDETTHRQHLAMIPHLIDMALAPEQD